MVNDAYAMFGGGQTGGSGGGGLMAFLPLILIFVIMYVLIIRPQQKKQKELQRMLDSLKKGDKIVTSGGIHGQIVGIKEKEQTLIVKVDDNVKIELSRAAVARILGE